MRIKTQLAERMVAECVALRTVLIKIKLRPRFPAVERIRRDDGNVARYPIAAVIVCDKPVK